MPHGTLMFIWVCLCLSVSNQLYHWTYYISPELYFREYMKIYQAFTVLVETGKKKKIAPSLHEYLPEFLHALHQ